MSLPNSRLYQESICSSNESKLISNNYRLFELRGVY